MKLKVQEYLETHNLEQLEEEHSLKVVQDGGLVLLGYKQIESSGANEIQNECRGLILENNTWNIVNFPFRRFFNFGEGFASKKLDWNKAVALEKLDGTLISLWNYKDKWHVSTRGMLYADGGVGDYGLTFRELFEEAVAEHGGFDEFVKDLDEDYTFCFELTSYKNRIVKDL